ncbi:MAG: HK97 family phage prohead protease [Planctomycetota bacterium]
MPSPGKLTGYALLYNVLSADRGGYRARFAPGSIKYPEDGDVRALYGHSELALLGRVSSGTLQLQDDGTGIKFALDLPDTTVGRDVAELVRRKDIVGCSFGIWSITKSSWVVEDDIEIQDYGQCVMDEITITGNPSFPQSSVRLIEPDQPDPGTPSTTPRRNMAALALADIELQAVA